MVVSNQCIQRETGITRLKGDADVQAEFVIFNKTRPRRRFHNRNLTFKGAILLKSVLEASFTCVLVFKQRCFPLGSECDSCSKFISETFCWKTGDLRRCFLV